MNIYMIFLCLILLNCDSNKNDVTFSVQCNLSEYQSGDYIELGPDSVEIVEYNDQRKYLGELQNRDFMQINSNSDISMKSYVYLIKACTHNIQNITSEASFNIWKEYGDFIVDYSMLNNTLRVHSFALSQSDETRVVILKVTTPIAITDVTAFAAAAG